MLFLDFWFINKLVKNKFFVCWELEIIKIGLGYKNVLSSNLKKKYVDCKEFWIIKYLMLMMIIWDILMI